ncbi:MAG: HK97 family phage prohead protease [Atopobiaceae bacterium]|nr:HK97 family phage prohead protease [Atopobiaceae bacterium]
MPYRPLERQYRNMAQPLAVTKRAGYEKRFESDFYVEGYASTFDDPYVLFKDPWDGTEYKEIVRADAFSDAVMDDVIMQFDHRGRVYARMSNRTLVVEPDKHGLFTAADLKSTETSRSLYEDIDAGLITRMSWAFTIEDQEFDRAEHTYIIKKVRRIYDVSAVSLPADPNTDISARNMLDGEIERAHKEFERSRNRQRAKARALAAIATSIDRKKV